MMTLIAVFVIGATIGFVAGYVFAVMWMKGAL